MGIHLQCRLGVYVARMCEAGHVAKLRALCRSFVTKALGWMAARDDDGIPSAWAPPAATAQQVRGRGGGGGGTVSGVGRSVGRLGSSHACAGAGEDAGALCAVVLLHVACCMLHVACCMLHVANNVSARA